MKLVSALWWTNNITLFLDLEHTCLSISCYLVANIPTVYGVCVCLQ